MNRFLIQTGYLIIINYLYVSLCCHLFSILINFRCINSLHPTPILPYLICPILSLENLANKYPFRLYLSFFTLLLCPITNCTLVSPTPLLLLLSSLSLQHTLSSSHLILSNYVYNWRNLSESFEIHSLNHLISSPSILFILQNINSLIESFFSTPQLFRLLSYQILHSLQYCHSTSQTYTIVTKKAFVFRFLLSFE